MQHPDILLQHPYKNTYNISIKHIKHLKYELATYKTLVAIMQAHAQSTRTHTLMLPRRPEHRAERQQAAGVGVAVARRGKHGQPQFVASAGRRRRDGHHLHCIAGHREWAQQGYVYGCCMSVEQSTLPYYIIALHDRRSYPEGLKNGNCIAAC
jgi:hypothetical protein